MIQRQKDVGRRTAQDTKPRHVAGRPADAELTQRILEATVALLMETGYAGLRIETVARHAECGKTAVYRRYRSKPELVAAAVLSVTEDSPEPDTGSLVEDLVEHAMVNGRNSASLINSDPDSVGLSAAFDPEVYGILWERCFCDRHRRGMDLIKRGIARGQIDQRADADAIIDAIAGFILYRQTVKHIEIIPEHYRDLITALVAHPPLHDRGNADATKSGVPQCNTAHGDGTQAQERTLT